MDSFACVYCQQPAPYFITTPTLQREEKAATCCERCFMLTHQMLQFLQAGEPLILGKFGGDVVPPPEPLPREAETLAVLEAMEIFKKQWGAMERLAGVETEAEPEEEPEKPDASPYIF